MIWNVFFIIGMFNRFSRNAHLHVQSKGMICLLEQRGKHLLNNNFLLSYANVLNTILQSMQYTCIQYALGK